MIRTRPKFKSCGYVWWWSHTSLVLKCKTCFCWRRQIGNFGGKLQTYHHHTLPPFSGYEHFHKWQTALLCDHEVCWGQFWIGKGGEVVIGRSFWKSEYHRGHLERVPFGRKIPHGPNYTYHFLRFEKRLWDIDNTTHFQQYYSSVDKKIGSSINILGWYIGEECEFKRGCHGVQEW